MYKIINSKSIEFGNCIYRLIYRKYLKKESENIGFKPNDIVEKNLDILESKIPISLYNEIKFLVEKHHIYGYINTLAMDFPDKSEVEILEYIDSIPNEDFYEHYIIKTLNPDNLSEKAVKEEIKLSNENNTRKSCPSFSYLKKIKNNTNDYKTKLIKVLRDFLPIYNEIKQNIYYITESATKKYMEYSKNDDIFEELLTSIDTNLLNKYSNTKEVYVNSFNDYSITIGIDKPTTRIMLGSSLTILLSDSFKKKQNEEIFKCLADSTKNSILNLISKEELCANEIAQKLNLTKSTISHHINKLLSSGLIILNTKEGNKVYYKINIQRMKTAFDEKINEFMK